MVTQKARSKSISERKEKITSPSTTPKPVEDIGLALSQSSPSSPSSLATLVPSIQDIEDILTFETVKKLAEFYRVVGWTPAMELQILINIIRTTDNDITKLRALKDLQNRRGEILRNSGLMVKATRIQKDADGGQTMFSANVVAAALNYNPKGVINEQEQEKEKTRLSTETPAEEPLGNDGDARSVSGGDGGDGGEERDVGGGADTTSGTSGTSGTNIGHRPPSGSIFLTGVATRRG